MSRKSKPVESTEPTSTIGALLNTDNRLKPPPEPCRVIGIDLGTTNCVISEIVLNSETSGMPSVRCIEVEQFTYEGVYTHTLVPSVVALHGDRELVGEGAKRLRARVAELGLRQNQNLFYECKNDMGVRKTYHLAPEGYRSAAEIAGKVLRFLHGAVVSERNVLVKRTVVTAPASFQASQREDTQTAARLAGIPLHDGDLLDEPLAAFLDFIVTQKPASLLQRKSSANLVVFDFGGGTCDVAVFRLEPGDADSRMRISPLAVSRYHRLGGGDIDAAIVHEVLMPQVIEQNGLTDYSLGFVDKREFVAPALSGIAERLKIGLCIEIERQRQFGKYDDADKSAVSKTLPGVYHCSLPNRPLQIKSPQITAARFEELLEPFLDRDLLYARDTEYRLTCSIFAPLQDALERADIQREEVHACLLVGGSSLIPQVYDAVKHFFRKAEVLRYRDRDSVQLAVARGAAVHALSLAMYEQPAIQPVCHDTISIRTSAGLIELIPKGSHLPFPSAHAECAVRGLLVPATSLVESVEILVEIVAGDGAEARPQFRGRWSIPPPCSKGDPLDVMARYDANQVLHLELRIANREDVEPCRFRVDNPLTNVVNPSETRVRVEELEESIRSGHVPRADIPERLIEIADLSTTIGHREKALELYCRVLRARNGADASILSKMAMVCGDLGDYDRQEKLYREAAKHTDWNGPWFNLALAQRQRKLPKEALSTINKAIDMDKNGPELTLKAMIQSDMGDEVGKNQTLKEALSLYSPVRVLIDWELGWYLSAARMAGETEAAKTAEREQKRRRVKTTAGVSEGMLPDARGDLRRGQ